MPACTETDIAHGTTLNLDLCDDDCSTLICSPPYGDERNGVSYAQFSRNMLAWLGYTPQALRQSKALTLGWGKDERTAPVSPTLSRALGAITAFPDSGREAVAFYADYQAALAEMARVTSGAIVIVIGQRVLRDTVFDNGAITTELNATDWGSISRVILSQATNQAPAEDAEVWCSHQPRINPGI